MPIESATFEVPAELAAHSPEGSPSFGRRTPVSSGWHTPRSQASGDPAETAEAVENAMDVDVAPVSSDRENTFVEDAQETEEGPQDQDAASVADDMEDEDDADRWLPVD